MAQKYEYEAGVEEQSSFPEMIESRSRVIKELDSFTTSNLTLEKTISKTLQGSVKLATRSISSIGVGGEDSSTSSPPLDKYYAVKIADVRLASNRMSGNGRRVAENIFHEYQIMKVLSEQPHDNVLRMYDAYCDENNIYLVLEYCENGELYELIEKSSGKGLEESVCKNYFSQIVRGVHHFHRMNIAHLDLSLENIFVDGEYNMKIADFGVAREFKEGENDLINLKSRFERPGKQSYMSPEITRSLPFRAKHSDIFSLGVILFTMLYGFPPFEQATLSDTRYNRIAKQGLLSLLKDWKLDRKVSPDAVQLISRMLSTESERITIEEILAHPWLEK